MKIKSLHIRNVGPFKDATVDFTTIDSEETYEAPITIITGMNGAGKSIVIDSIRAILSSQSLERNIVADDKDFCIEIDAMYNEHGIRHLSATHLENGHLPYVDYEGLNKPFLYGYKQPGKVYGWVADYWSSKLPTDSFQIKNMVNIEHDMVLKDAMVGKNGI